MSLHQELKSVITRHLDSAPAGDVLKIVSALCAPAPVVVTGGRTSPAARWIKIGADGQALPASAADWVAVYDSEHDLTWARRGSKTQHTWKAAQEFASSVDLCGVKEWRLPTIVELLTLVEYERSEPSIRTDMFECESSFYWTCTPYAGAPADIAWVVYFYGGSSSWYSLADNGFVRAVRSGQQLALGI